MRRRGVLVALLAASGCLGGDAFDVSPDGSAAPDESPTATANAADSSKTTAAAVRVERFVETERCPTPGDAAVRVADADVVVAGCVRGATECAVPTLSAAGYDAAADALTVIVGTDTRDASDACAASLPALGYRVRVGLARGPPSAVSVVHDDADGHREVARREADATTHPSAYTG